MVFLLSPSISPANELSVRRLCLVPPIRAWHSLHLLSSAAFLTTFFVAFTFLRRFFNHILQLRKYVHWDIWINVPLAIPWPKISLCALCRFPHRTFLPTLSLWYVNFMSKVVFVLGRLFRDKTWSAYQWFLSFWQLTLITSRFLLHYQFLVGLFIGKA